MSLRSHLSAAAVLALAALALAASFAIRTPQPGVAADGPAAMAVKASLDSCTDPKGGNGRTCELSVSFDPLAAAGSYEVTISAPDGSELLTEPAEPGTDSYSVPYSGNGTYAVRVTAFQAATPVIRGPRDH